MVNFFNIKKDEILSKHCSFLVGGSADLYYEPTNLEEFVYAIKFCISNKIKYFILGNGTNTIFTDSGFRGMVICTNKLTNITRKNCIICCECGVNMFSLNEFVKNNCLGGMEWSYGIPGTVGGAVCMNAGAYGSEMKNFVLKAKVFDGQKTNILYSNELGFAYRDSIVKQRQLIVLKVWLLLKNEEQDTIEQKQKECYKKRLVSQPLSYPNFGSVFKKVAGVSVGKIVEDLGLKGLRVGGAEISKLHGNFIINIDKAKCNDVLNIIEIIINKVYTKKGIILEKEVQVIGEYNGNLG